MSLPAVSSVLSAPNIPAHRCSSHVWKVSDQSDEARPHTSHVPRGGHRSAASHERTRTADPMEGRQVYWPGQMHDLSRGISTTPFGSGRGSKISMPWDDPSDDGSGRGTPNPVRCGVTGAELLDASGNGMPDAWLIVPREEPQESGSWSSQWDTEPGVAQRAVRIPRDHTLAGIAYACHGHQSSSGFPASEGLRWQLAGLLRLASGGCGCHNATPWKGVPALGVEIYMPPPPPAEADPPSSISPWGNAMRRSPEVSRSLLAWWTAIGGGDPKPPTRRNPVENEKNNSRERSAEGTFLTAGAEEETEDAVGEDGEAGSASVPQEAPGCLSRGRFLRVGEAALRALEPREGGKSGACITKWLENLWAGMTRLDGADLQAMEEMKEAPRRRRGRPPGRLGATVESEEPREWEWERLADAPLSLLQFELASLEMLAWWDVGMEPSDGSGLLDAMLEAFVIAPVGGHMVYGRGPYSSLCSINPCYRSADA